MPEVRCPARAQAACRVARLYSDSRGQRGLSPEWPVSGGREPVLVQRAGRAFERRRAGGTSTRINSWPFRLHARDLHAMGTQTCDMRPSA